MARQAIVELYGSTAWWLDDGWTAQWLSSLTARRLNGWTMAEQLNGSSTARRLNGWTTQWLNFSGQHGRHTMTAIMINDAHLIQIFLLLSLSL
jgi:hypothetical protein